MTTYSEAPQPMGDRFYQAWRAFDYGSGREVPPGKVLGGASPIVQGHPEFFVEAGDELEMAQRQAEDFGGPPEDAKVALATCRHTNRAGDLRVVYAGQWVARDDPLVALHPHQFTLPASEPKPVDQEAE